MKLQFSRNSHFFLKGKYAATAILFCCFLQFINADIFISEYIEGTSYNKALELYNPDEEAVDLGAAGYSVEVYFNGNTTANMIITLTGFLAGFDVYVIAPTNIDTTLFPVNEVDLFYGTSWFNGDDTVVLKKGEEIIDHLGQVGFDPGSEWGSGLQSTMDNTLRRRPGINTGNPAWTEPFDPTVEWDGYSVNTFDGLGSHPGKPVPTPVFTATPSPPPSPTPVPTPTPEYAAIFCIQGAGHQSPYTGRTVVTRGIVTLAAAGGFYLQDSTGDQDSATSDAIYVYTGVQPAVRAGDLVEVEGLVTEYIPGGASSDNLSITEFSRPRRITLLSGGNTLPAPVIVGTGGRHIPDRIIEDDNFKVFDPEEDGIDFYESLEAMLVSVPGAMAVAPVNLYHEIFVAADYGREATGINRRSGITLTADDYNPERIQVQIDDSLLPGFAPQIETGDYLEPVAGVISYAFGNYELLAAAPFDVISHSYPREITGLANDTDHLTIASFNMENLDPDSSDGDDDAGSGKVDGLADQVVNRLLCPDIIAVQEIQDNDGAIDSGTVAAGRTFAMLTAAISAAGGTAYSWCSLEPENNRDGGQPGANIRVGYLYNASRLTLVPESLYRITDPGYPDTDAFRDSRKPLRADFLFNGERITVINCHLASKGGSSPLFGAIQPYINGSEEQRNEQAAVINRYVKNLQAADSSAKIVVLGDFNEFWFAPPLLTLEGTDGGLINLTTTLPETERYSYLYEGNSQELDHILVSPALTAAADFDIVHMNAEYSMNYTDHDPVICRLFLPAPGTAEVRFFKGYGIGRTCTLFCWVTTEETNIAGWNLYAAAAPGADRIKINRQLITRSRSCRGNNYYQFRGPDVFLRDKVALIPGKKYYYLEAVDTRGNGEIKAEYAAGRHRTTSLHFTQRF